ncbi:uncharacterized protein C12orf45 homolog [Exaiptasia diaphana]|uniref:Uncharacterized protein n=1 Tax=Exaiptasia diaphana TaxID=2652724 RepID=A0A913XUJ6_EXADI|nr:uncharacterized protein C12orf45 homolog [Exaiptasia diaphana]KXJ20053.1 Uncharacterized protein C12orf45 [Exaiptasia diaphana]
MASHKQDKSSIKPNSKDLMDFPMMSASLRSKLMLSEQTRKSKGPPKTFKVGKSSVLDRVQTFLPLMAEADQKLKEDLQSLPSGSLNIENVKEDQEHVEMSLALVENDYDDSEPSSESSCSEEESDSEDIKTEYIDNGKVTEDNLVLKKPSQKPVIEILKNGKSSPDV